MVRAGHARAMPGAMQGDGGGQVNASVALFVAISTIPARLPGVGLTILSLAAQTSPPRKILLSAPRSYLRFPGKVADLSLVHKQLQSSSHREAPRALELLETHTCERDDGPGSKLLCVLERLHTLAHELPLGAGEPMVVLADDDRQYKPNALRLVSTAVSHRSPHPPAALAYSFNTYPLPQASPTVSIGQGADLYAIPLRALGSTESVRHFFELSLGVDPRFRFHDDVWISLYLSDVRGVPACDVISRLNEARHDEYSESSGAIAREQQPQQQQGLPTPIPPSAEASGARGPPPSAMAKEPKHEPKLLGAKDKLQFMGPVHGVKGSAAWATSLRRLGLNGSRSAMTAEMGRVARPRLLGAAREAGLLPAFDRPVSLEPPGHLPSQLPAGLLPVSCNRRAYNRSNLQIFDELESQTAATGTDAHAVPKVAAGPHSSVGSFQTSGYFDSLLHQYARVTARIGRGDRGGAKNMSGRAISQATLPSGQNVVGTSQQGAASSGRSAGGSGTGVKIALDSTRAALWLSEACPFEETRHSCFFFGQPGADAIAQWAGGAVTPLDVDRTLQSLAGQTIVFVGDSVLRQLAHATMCRLRRRLRHDGTVWRNPMKRRHPSLDYEGVCPFPDGKHCEQESGCSTFGAPLLSNSTSGGGSRGGGGGRGGSRGGNGSSTLSSASSSLPPLKLCFLSSGRVGSGWKAVINAATTSTGPRGSRSARRACTVVAAVGV